MHTTMSRRRALAAGAVSVALLVSACAGDGSAPEDSPGAGDASGAFPVTIQHRYGATTIESEPKRVVTVGLTEQDALLALGIVPVATTRWLGDDPGAVGAWARDELGEAQPPEVLDDTGGVQFEKVAAQRPDLIVGIYSSLTKEDYEKLSQIAPTIAPPEGYPDFGVPWQEVTKTVGKAVGRAGEADRLVGDVERRLAEARRAHPEFAGATALVATVFDGYWVYGSDDPRTRTLTALGFRLPEEVDKAIGDQFGANISRERVDLLDTDAIVWLLADGDAKLREDAAYQNLRVVEEGRQVFIDDGSDYGKAVSFVSVLSLPYVLDRLVPQLAAAVDGDPGTEVGAP
ncbi:iron complex transport system substrate-binding protein [Prauserella shujinwangii]|uniref:Iron complex transport system substrate-binding protein n=1 Tax=Prauserella shujinwangii TaxID=1453103 RepID=A0A2T0LND7_9PSEU|nr:iron-siderophore ABC transporter substrate-binding protein [Prauserella shujinwangii]PRX44704.1 iron complex transport system substrate-binding protein [Prauserella shujinwangii]